MSNNIGRLIYPHNFIEEIRGSLIILDTTILIGCIVDNPAYIELFHLLKINDCSFFTIDLCVFEFLKGSEKLGDKIKKEKFLETWDIPYLLSSELTNEFYHILSIYRKSGATIEIPDLFLAAILKRYDNNPKTYLLTANYTDFPVNYFQRKHILIAEEEKHIKPLVFLQLHKDNFIKGSKSFYS